MRRNRIDRVCQYCETPFTVTPARLKEGRGKFCSRPCADKAKVGKQWAIYVERVCQQCGKRFSLRASLLKSQPGKYCSKLCQNRAIANPADLKVRERKAKLVSITSKRRWQTPEYAARVSKSQRIAQKKKWQDPEIVAKMLAGINKKPTKPEEKLIGILQKHFPQFEYNGDFSLGVILGGLIPDFVNVNGRKEVIEVLGDFWHSPEIVGDRWQGTELGKVMLYNSLGYRCLAIWGHELKEFTEDQIISKINSFFKKGKRSAAVQPK